MQKEQKNIESNSGIQSSKLLPQQGFNSLQNIPGFATLNQNNQVPISEKDKQSFEIFFKACQDFQTKQIVFQTLTLSQATLLSKKWQERKNMRQKNKITIRIEKGKFQNQCQKEVYIQLFQHFKSIRLVLGEEVYQNKQAILYQDGNTFYEGSEEFMVIYWQDQEKRYVGQVKAVKQGQQYRAEGQGTMHMVQGKHKIAYFGFFKNGIREGQGKEYKGQTYVYQGQWKDDMKNGKGKQTHFSRKRVKSKNTIKLVEKSYFQGQFVQGKREGQGLQKSVDGVYQGEWHQGLKHGKGKMSYNNGDIYEGQWCQGSRQGKGIYKEDVSSAYHKEKGVHYNIYEGDFKDGVYHGTGTIVYADESTYQGQWESNKRHGKGLYKWKDGEYYDGNWFKGMAQGIGQSLTGDIFYDGEYYLGQKNGLGEETDLEGNTTKGIWDKGKLVKKIMVNGQEVPQGQQDII